MAMHYYILSRIIERVGDHAVRIAEHSLPIIDVELDKKTLTYDKESQVPYRLKFLTGVLYLFSMPI